MQPVSSLKERLSSSLWGWRAPGPLSLFVRGPGAKEEEGQWMLSLAGFLAWRSGIPRVF